MASSAPRRTSLGLTRGRIRFRLLVGLIVAMFVFPAFAAAQGSNPARDQYNDIPGAAGAAEDQYKDIPACLNCGDPDGGLGGNVGPLPFTGFDVIAMVAVALGVTGVGLALQRAVARESR